MNIRAVIFDKDGTLIDFSKTFNPATRYVLEQLSNGDQSLMQAMADIWDFDLEKNIIRDTSMIIADSGFEIANALSPVIDIQNPGKFAEELDAMFGEFCLNSVIEIPGACDTLRLLHEKGIKLAVGTNDSEENAKLQMRSLKIEPLFHSIFGADSGHGAKPGSGMVAAFIERTGFSPSQVMMVGDSLHDLEAGRGCGAVTCGVETGPAVRATLEKQADIVLPSIADLPGHLGLSV